MARVRQARMRRAFDVVVATTGLAVALVPCAIAAVLIKATSPGPVLFGQRRVGRGGATFTLWKLRTMRVGDGGPAVTAARDPRVTAVGRWLRATKVDELPQLWNVLRGDMAVIGPRPEVERFVAAYTPAMRRVLDARPGLAGMAQVRFADEARALVGHPDPERAYVEEWMPRKVAADLEYETRRTLASDVVLLGRLGLLVLGWGRSPRTAPATPATGRV